ncbi:MAG: putative sulfate exporter family transporter, partial [Candidatus Electrothrix sp. ATG1]|nr:putative sulfate exporter family transporter [Candidatus Electrothrix sp. ATG1]
AAYQMGDVALEQGIIVKLARVIAIVPVCLLFSFLVQRGFIKQEGGDDEAQPVIPLFIIGFLIMLTLNSVGFFTPEAVKWINVGAMFCLTTAIAGMGLETDFNLIKRIGYKPMLLITFSTLCISLSSLALIKFFH